MLSQDPDLSKYRIMKATGVNREIVEAWMSKGWIPTIKKVHKSGGNGPWRDSNKDMFKRIPRISDPKINF